MTSVKKTPICVKPDSKGRISLAKLLAPEERGELWFVTKNSGGAFLIERAKVKVFVRGKEVSA